MFKNTANGSHLLSSFLDIRIATRPYAEVLYPLFTALPYTAVVILCK